MTENLVPSAAQVVPVLVVGGGAAGMLAAISACRAFRKTGNMPVASPVLILERNRRLGEKIRVSGGGRCNITHTGSPQELLGSGFLSQREQRFLRHALHGFAPEALLALLEEAGIRVVARADGKMFPESGNANDVAEALERLTGSCGVAITYGERVLSVAKKGDYFHVATERASYTSRTLIIATGGVSWPGTGSTGDGYDIAIELGHKVEAASAALAPIFTDPAPPSGLAGVSLKRIVLVCAGRRTKVMRRGDLLFTHRGLSGPVALSLSRHAMQMRSQGERVSLYIDLFPDQGQAVLEEALLEQGRRHGGQMVRKFLQACPLAPEKSPLVSSPEMRTIPTALVPMIMQRAGTGADITWGQLSRKGRHALLQVLKGFDVGMIAAIPLRQGEVTAGGVTLAEVDQKTMQSRIAGGLYFAGEVLDYTGEIGGYNLQAAFSTGWIAGQHAVASLFQA